MTVVINTTWAEWARAGRRKMCSTWEKVQNSGCKHLDDPVGICRTTSPNPIIWHSLLNVNYKFDLTGHYLRRPNNKYIYGTVRDGRKSHCAVRPGLRSWISQWVLRGGSIQTWVGTLRWTGFRSLECTCLCPCLLWGILAPYHGHAAYANAIRPVSQM